MSDLPIEFVPLRGKFLKRAAALYGLKRKWFESDLSFRKRLNSHMMNLPRSSPSQRADFFLNSGRVGMKIGDAIAFKPDWSAGYTCENGLDKETGIYHGIVHAFKPADDGGPDWIVAMLPGSVQMFAGRNS